MTVESDDFWRKAINDLNASTPEEGDQPPEIENIKNKKPIKDGNRKVTVQKVVTQIYVFTDVEGKVYTANTSQKMVILGTMSLSRALKLAQEDQFD